MPDFNWFYLFESRVFDGDNNHGEKRLYCALSSEGSEEYYTEGMLAEFKTYLIPSIRCRKLGSRYIKEDKLGPINWWRIYDHEIPYIGEWVRGKQPGYWDRVTCHVKRFERDICQKK